jgi:magnesium transporter
MERIIEEIDQKVFSVKPQDIIEQISFLRRNVIYFETMIKPELTYFSSIEDIHHELLSYDTKIYFTNISDHLKKVWDRLDDIRELVDNLSRTFEGYFSFKTNETIKVLTIFSVILMPLTLLSGIYGMNLNILPFAEHPLALAIITAMMLGIVLAMLIVFKIRKWI